MTPGVRRLVAGNWKMNGLARALGEIDAVSLAAREGAGERVDIAVFPPLTLLAAACARLQGGPIRLGAQDCHWEPNGPFTGDVSAEMIADAGAAYVIVGHSERREAYGESDARVRAKAEAALRAGLTAIVCVGESRAQRESGDAVAVVCAQLRGSLPPVATPADTVVAYEPIWAIGAGLTPTPEEVTDIHAAIRALLRELYGEAGTGMRILYGGSVKPVNAAALAGLPNVDGALVGGASLKASDFMAVAAAYG